VWATFWASFSQNSSGHSVRKSFFFSTGDFLFGRDENAELLRKMALPKKKKTL
jgi:hypothetical protein